MSYRFQLEHFEGPLDLLLQLIEEEKLPITQVSLAQVTDQFLQHLQSIEQRYPEELADFLVVAARLVLIKSRALLPIAIDEEDDGVDLEEQLKIYREYYLASKQIHGMILTRRYSFSRNASLKIAPKERSFRPPEKLFSEDLHNIFQVMLKRLEPFITIPEETIARTINLKEKLESIRRKIMTEVRMNFHTLVSQASSKVEVIVTFLALLELVKQRTITVEQNGIFSTIEIERREILNSEPIKS